MTAAVPRVPDGLRDLMKGYTKEVLREKPQNIYEFSLNYFETLLKNCDDYVVKHYEQSKSYDYTYRNRDYNRVPIAIVFKIIPETLTELIKNFIKAVLKENPQNICEFGVDYFKSLQQTIASNNDVQYKTYENFLNNREHFSLTPFMKCTCNRSFEQDGNKGNSVKETQQHLVKDKNGRVFKETSENTFGAAHEKFKVTSAHILTNSTTKDKLISNSTHDVYDEVFLKAVYVIQRFYRNWVKIKHIKTSCSPNIHSNENLKLSQVAAAVIIQRSFRKFFARKFQQSLQTHTDAPIITTTQYNEEMNDNISEAASYTSAATVRMSAESAAEIMEKESSKYETNVSGTQIVSQPITQVDIQQNIKSTGEDIEIFTENTKKSISSILKDIGDDVWESDQHGLAALETLEIEQSKDVNDSSFDVKEGPAKEALQSTLIANIGEILCAEHSQLENNNRNLDIVDNHHSINSADSIHRTSETIEILELLEKDENVSDSIEELAAINTQSESSSNTLTEDKAKQSNNSTDMHKTKKNHIENSNTTLRESIPNGDIQHSKTNQVKSIESIDIIDRGKSNSKQISNDDNLDEFEKIKASSLERTLKTSTDQEVLNNDALRFEDVAFIESYNEELPAQTFKAENSNPQTNQDIINTDTNENIPNQQSSIGEINEREIDFSCIEKNENNDCRSAQTLEKWDEQIAYEISQDAKEVIYNNIKGFDKYQDGEETSSESKNPIKSKLVNTDCEKTESHRIIKSSSLQKELQMKQNEKFPKDVSAEFNDDEISEKNTDKNFISNEIDKTEQENLLHSVPNTEISEEKHTHSGFETKDVSAIFNNDDISEKYIDHNYITINTDIIEQENLQHSVPNTEISEEKHTHSGFETKDVSAIFNNDDISEKYIDPNYITINTDIIEQENLQHSVPNTEISEEKHTHSGFETKDVSPIFNNDGISEKNINQNLISNEIDKIEEENLLNSVPNTEISGEKLTHSDFETKDISAIFNNDDISEKYIDQYYITIDSDKINQENILHGVPNTEISEEKLIHSGFETKDVSVIFKNDDNSEKYIDQNYITIDTDKINQETLLHSVPNTEISEEKLTHSSFETKDDSAIFNNDDISEKYIDHNNITIDTDIIEQENLLHSVPNTEISKEKHTHSGFETKDVSAIFKNDDISDKYIDHNNITIDTDIIEQENLLHSVPNTEISEEKHTHSGFETKDVSAIFNNDGISEKNINQNLISNEIDKIEEENLLNSVPNTEISGEKLTHSDFETKDVSAIFNKDGISEKNINQNLISNEIDKIEEENLLNSVPNTEISGEKLTHSDFETKDVSAIFNNDDISEKYIDQNYITIDTDKRNQENLLHSVPKTEISEDNFSLPSLETKDVSAIFNNDDISEKHINQNLISLQIDKIEEENLLNSVLNTEISEEKLTHSGFEIKDVSAIFNSDDISEKYIDQNYITIDTDKIEKENLLHSVPKTEISEGNFSHPSFDKQNSTNFNNQNKSSSQNDTFKAQCQSDMSKIPADSSEVIAFRELSLPQLSIEEKEPTNDAAESQMINNTTKAKSSHYADENMKDTDFIKTLIFKPEESEEEQTIIKVDATETNTAIKISKEDNIENHTDEQESKHVLRDELTKQNYQDNVLLESLRSDSLNLINTDPVRSAELQTEIFSEFTKDKSLKARDVSDKYEADTSEILVEKEVNVHLQQVFEENTSPCTESLYNTSIEDELNIKSSFSTKSKDCTEEETANQINTIKSNQTTTEQKEKQLEKLHQPSSEQCKENKVNEVKIENLIEPHISNAVHGKISLPLLTEENLTDSNSSEQDSATERQEADAAGSNKKDSSQEIGNYEEENVLFQKNSQGRNESTPISEINAQKNNSIKQGFKNNCDITPISLLLNKPKLQEAQYNVNEVDINTNTLEIQQSVIIISSGEDTKTHNEINKILEADQNVMDLSKKVDSRCPLDDHVEYVKQDKEGPLKTAIDIVDDNQQKEEQDHEIGMDHLQTVSTLNQPGLHENYLNQESQDAEDSIDITNDYVKNIKNQLTESVDKENKTENLPSQPNITSNKVLNYSLDLLKPEDVQELYECEELNDLNDKNNCDPNKNLLETDELKKIDIIEHGPKIDHDEIQRTKRSINNNNQTVGKTTGSGDMDKLFSEKENEFNTEYSTTYVPDIKNQSEKEGTNYKINQEPTSTEELQINSNNTESDSLNIKEETADINNHVKDARHCKDAYYGAGDSQTSPKKEFNTTYVNLGNVSDMLKSTNFFTFDKQDTGTSSPKILLENMYRIKITESCNSNKEETNSCTQNSRNLGSISDKCILNESKTSFPDMSINTVLVENDIELYTKSNIADILTCLNEDINTSNENLQIIETIGNAGDAPKELNYWTLEPDDVKLKTPPVTERIATYMYGVHKVRHQANPSSKSLRKIASTHKTPSPSKKYPLNSNKSNSKSNKNDSMNESELDSQTKLLNAFSKIDNDEKFTALNEHVKMQETNYNTHYVQNEDSDLQHADFQASSSVAKIIIEHIGSEDYIEESIEKFINEYKPNEIEPNAFAYQKVTEYAIPLEILSIIETEFNTNNLNPKTEELETPFRMKHILYDTKVNKGDLISTTKKDRLDITSPKNKSANITSTLFMNKSSLHNEPVLFIQPMKIQNVEKEDILRISIWSDNFLSIHIYAPKVVQNLFKNYEKWAKLYFVETSYDHNIQDDIEENSFPKKYLQLVGVNNPQNKRSHYINDEIIVLLQGKFSSSILIRKNEKKIDWFVGDDLIVCSNSKTPAPLSVVIDTSTSPFSPSINSIAAENIYSSSSLIDPDYFAPSIFTKLNHFGGSVSAVKIKAGNELLIEEESPRTSVHRSDAKNVCNSIREKIKDEIHDDNGTSKKNEEVETVLKACVETALLNDQEPNIEVDHVVTPRPMSFTEEINEKGIALQKHRSQEEISNSEIMSESLVSSEVLELASDFLNSKTFQQTDMLNSVSLFLELEREYWVSNIPYVNLEKECIKKIATLKALKENTAFTEINENESSASSSSNVSDQEGVDSLEASTEKLRSTDVVIEKMHQKYTVESRGNSVDESAFIEANFDEPSIMSMKELEESASYAIDHEDIVLKPFNREITRESSEQSDCLVYGSDENSSIGKQLVKTSLRRNHTIPGDDANVVFQQVTVDETIKNVEPQQSEATGTNNGCSFCLDEDTSENIRQKMMAYSLSEADSDYLGAEIVGDSGNMGNSSLFPDDFNITTALEDLERTSTETESTIVSAATKIQAGARGFLTRRRLKRASLGTKASFHENNKASFGNAAIDESLERLVEEEAAKKIQAAFRQYHRKRKNSSKPNGQTFSESFEKCRGNDFVEAKDNSFSSFEAALAARRHTLQRGDAMHNDSAPDEENSVSPESDRSIKSFAVQKKQNISIKEETIDAPNTSNGMHVKGELKWIALRQNSMPVQIESEIFRVIPKHMRKRIMSAGGENKRRTRILND